MQTIWRIVALCSVLLLGCTDNDREGLGQFEVALESRSPTGAIYRLRRAAFRITPLDGLSMGQVVTSEDEPGAPTIDLPLAAGGYEVVLEPGWFLERELPNGFIQSVPNAELVSPAIQLVRIVPGTSSFVSFTFATEGGIIVIGDPGLLTIEIDVIEGDAGPPRDTGPDTGPPRPDGGDGGPPGADIQSGLVETNPRVLESFTLREVLDRMGINEGLPANADRIYGAIIDSYASAANGRLSDVIHCGDERTNGVATLNGYPITCDRLEAQQFDNLDRWFPLALFSRLDFAPLDGSHCGQQRIVFANNEPIGAGRMFIILEAQVPNPSPECGPAACRPIAEAWEAASNAAPAVRGQMFREMFLEGSPELQSQGIEPFVTASAYTVGSGQIRTNNFNDFTWTLREFKLALEPTGSVGVIPFPVAEAPHGALWNDVSPLPQGGACRANFLDALDSLLTDDPAQMAFVVDQECKDSESVNDGSQDYAFELSRGSGSFADLLDARLAGTGLTAEDIATRAQFAGSCIGCHLEANGRDLGRGVRAPFSRGFVHVDEFGTEPCRGNEQCFPISDALRTSFLPHRREVQNVLLGSSCGMTEPDAGVVDAGPVDAGLIILPPTLPDAGPRDAGLVLPPIVLPIDAGVVVRPAEPIEPVLVPIDTPVEMVVEQDTALRSDVSTLGGRPAAITH